jgi:uncharacterized protein (DUF433 family)
MASAQPTEKAVVRLLPLGSVNEHGIDLEHADKGLALAARWVLEAATPQEITWHYPNLKDISEWLKVHHAASELRQKAIRLELIALRKIGRSGKTYISRLHVKVQKVAEWLAEMNDDSFNNLLNNVAGTDTPLGLLNRSKKETAAYMEWLKQKHTEDGGILNELGDVGYVPMDLNNAVRAILLEIVQAGDPFTVSDATETLMRKLHRNYPELDFPDELTRGPLKQVVRMALRRGSDKATILVDQRGEHVRVPNLVTFQDERGYYYHVPFEAATLDQYEVMAEMRKEQMQIFARHFYEQNAHAEALRKAKNLYPGVNKVSDLHEIAVQMGFIITEAEDAVQESREAKGA